MARMPAGSMEVMYPREKTEEMAPWVGLVCRVNGWVGGWVRERREEMAPWVLGGWVVLVNCVCMSWGWGFVGFKK